MLFYYFVIANIGERKRDPGDDDLYRKSLNLLFYI